MNDQEVIRRLEVIEKRLKAIEKRVHTIPTGHWGCAMPLMFVMILAMFLRGCHP